jgi:hypothetical protein
VAVWVVFGVLSVGAIAAVVASRRHPTDAEPTVREFAEFRDALSQQVVGLDTDVRATRTHLDAHTHPRPVEHDRWG